MSAQIIEVLNDLCSKFGIVIDWSTENVLPYLQNLVGKYIEWEILTSKIWIAMAMVVIVLGVIMMVLDVRFFMRASDLFFASTGLILIAIGLIVVTIQIFDIVTCLHFPEKQVFEYLKPYLKS